MFGEATQLPPSMQGGDVGPGRAAYPIPSAAVVHAGGQENSGFLVVVVQVIIMLYVYIVLARGLVKGRILFVYL